MAALSTMHLIYEVDSVEEFRAWLDKNLGELEDAGFARYLRRVILIGPADGAVCAVLKQNIAPGSSFKILPVPAAWAWLWSQRDHLLDVARRVG